MNKFRKQLHAKAQAAADLIISLDKRPLWMIIFIWPLGFVLLVYITLLLGLWFITGVFDDSTVTVDTFRWGQEVSTEFGRGSVIGRLVHEGGILVISIPPRGSSMFYCVKHQKAFSPMDQCPDCQAGDNDDAA